MHFIQQVATYSLIYWFWPGRNLGAAIHSSSTVNNLSHGQIWWKPSKVLLAVAFMFIVTILFFFWLSAARKWKRNVLADRWTKNATLWRDDAPFMDHYGWRRVENIGRSTFAGSRPRRRASALLLCRFIGSQRRILERRPKFSGAHEKSNSFFYIFKCEVNINLN